MRIVKLEGENRVAVGYKSILLPSGKMIIRRVFEDYYNLRIPNDVYNEYFERREQYLEEAISALEEFLAEEEEKRERRKRRREREMKV